MPAYCWCQGSPRYRGAALPCSAHFKLGSTFLRGLSPSNTSVCPIEPCLRPVEGALRLGVRLRQVSLKKGATPRTELNAAETSVVGALAGAVTGLVTTPLDVIKTRLMTQGVSRKYDGIFDCARKIAKQEGTATFFKVSRISQWYGSTGGIRRSYSSFVASLPISISLKRTMPVHTVQGWEPRVLWISIGGCIFFTALEEAKKLYAPKRHIEPL